MVITDTIDRHPRLRHAARAVSAALAMLAAQGHGQVHAADWKVSPGIGLRETYSDNIALTPDREARTELVTELIPRLDFSADSTRFKLKGYYALHYLNYQRDTSPSRTLHDANANAHADLLKDWLFFDGMVGISQQRISAFGAQSIDPINTTGNRTEVRTYNLSPYLRHDFSGSAVGELRYTWQKTTSGDTNLLDGSTDRVFADFRSGPTWTRWAWNLTADHEKIGYSAAPDVELNRYTAGLRYALTPRLSLNTTLGYEDNNYIVAGDDPAGAFWSVGASWTPSEVTSLSASAGHRYFGNTYSLAAQHRTTHAAWNLGYAEDVTTQNATSRSPSIDTAAFLNQLWSASIPDATARQRVVDAFIRTSGLPSTLAGNIGGLSNRVYLQKSWQGSVALDGVRNTVVLRVFSMRREPLSAATGATFIVPTSAAGLDDDSRQTGAAATWSLRLSPRTTLDSGAEITRMRSFSTDRVDRIRNVRIGLSQQLGRRTTGMVEIHRQQRISSVSAFDYTENALSIFVSMQF
jgi:uncharacterized protein (PEP-CTERM system associated)